MLLMRKPPFDERCTILGCQVAATIIHDGKQLCGKHALERLEQDIAASKAWPFKR